MRLPAGGKSDSDLRVRLRTPLPDNLYVAMSVSAVLGVRRMTIEHGRTWFSGEL